MRTAQLPAADRLAAAEKRLAAKNAPRIVRSWRGRASERSPGATRRGSLAVRAFKSLDDGARKFAVRLHRWAVDAQQVLVS
jgi:hypothetical protein